MPGHRTCQVYNVVTALTWDGHAGLGWPDSGGIAPGSLADLVTTGLDPPRLAGLASRRPPSAAMPDLTLLIGVIFTAAPADVRKVVISGGDAVADGWHLLVEDLPARFRPLSAPLRLNW
ncbi:MAG TPA: hypothetical protein DHU96_20730 [Actinobacteria bacterium]|nr:hypothetical protein [Actinomycetota bacterium]